MITTRSRNTPRSCQAPAVPEPLPLSCTGRCLANDSELRAELDEGSAAELCFCCRCAAATAEEPSRLAPIAATGRTEWSCARPVRPTDQTLTCAAKAHVATAARHTACLHVSRAMQAARRRDGFDFTSRLGRRAEAGPRQVLRRVSRP